MAAAASTFDANDRLLSDTSDDNGNTLSSEKGTDEYDFENRLLKRTKPDGTIVTLVYNADGDRMSKTVAATNGVTVTTRYLNDRNNPTGYSQVLEELDAAGNILAVNTFGHDLIAREAGTDVRYYVYDGHGCVRALTDASGIETDRYDYDAFGLLIQRQALNPLTGLLEDVPATFTGFPLHPSSFILQPYLYCGEFFDHDLGMTFLRARYMDPGRGRFWTMDSFEGYATDPVSLHKYLYANGEAVNGMDPSGNFTFLDILNAAGISNILDRTADAKTVHNYRRIQAKICAVTAQFLQPLVNVYEEVRKWTRGLGGKVQAHHIFQNAKMLNSLNYSKGIGLAMLLIGGSNMPYSPHDLANRVQSTMGQRVKVPEAAWYALRAAGCRNEDATTIVLFVEGAYEMSGILF